LLKKKKEKCIQTHLLFLVKDGMKKGEKRTD